MGRAACRGYRGHRHNDRKLNIKDVYLNTYLGSHSELKIIKRSGMAIWKRIQEILNPNYNCIITCTSP